MKQTVHTTPVKIDLEILDRVILEAKQAFLAHGDIAKSTSKARSLFSTFNSMLKMRERIQPLDHSETTTTLQVEGTFAPRVSARVYYKPSLTSLPAVFRKAIIPNNPKNTFIYFDLKAAEFFLAAHFAKQEDILQAYAQGEDVYDLYKSHFPPNVPRIHYKTIMIASLFGGTPFSSSKRLGISEFKAKRIHDIIKRVLPNIYGHQNTVALNALQEGFYKYPTNLQCTEFQQVDFKPHLRTKVVEFNPNNAMSAYIQSALGHFMQNLIHKTQEQSFFSPTNTLLTVFDSVLLEVSPQDADKAVRFFTEAIQPFRTDSMIMGKTFYEVYNPQ